MSILDYPPGFSGFLVRSLVVVGPALESIKDNRPWSSHNKSWTYPLGAYTFFGSAALLAHFYKTRQFVIDGKINYPDIGKFMAAVALLAYCNIRYFTS